MGDEGREIWAGCGCGCGCGWGIRMGPEFGLGMATVFARRKTTFLLPPAVKNGASRLNQAASRSQDRRTTEGGPRGHKPPDGRRAKLQGKLSDSTRNKTPRPGAWPASPRLAGPAGPAAWRVGWPWQSHGTASGCSGFSVPAGERERGQGREGNGIEERKATAVRETRDGNVQQETNARSGCK